MLLATSENDGGGKYRLVVARKGSKHRESIQDHMCEDLSIEPSAIRSSFARSWPQAAVHFIHSYVILADNLLVRMCDLQSTKSQMR